MYSVYLAESPSKRQKRAHDQGGDASTTEQSGPANKDGTSGSKDPKAADASAAHRAGPITPAAHIEQLITEHLGFNPRVYTDQLTQLANDHLHELKGPIEDEVRAELLQQGTRPNAELEAEQGVHALVTLIENALDHTFDTFDLYCLRSIFRVSPAQARAITLAHHRGLDLRSVEEKRANLARQNKGSGKSKGKGANAAADSQPVVLTAQEQSKALAERAVALRKRIAATRATNAALRAATAKSQQGLAELQDLENQLPALFSVDGAAQAEDEVMQHANAADLDAYAANTSTLSFGHAALGVKLRADTVKLLDAIGSLRESDPLGAPLVTASKDRTGPGGANGEVDPTAGPALPWTSRDSYLQFVADKART